MNGYQETRSRNRSYVRNAIAPIGTDQGEELLIGRRMDEIIAKLPEPYYRTEYGAAYLGDALELIRHVPDGRINLIMTSPPFALTKKKPYGNTKASLYVDWFKPFAREFWRILTEDGSLVIHIGGSWDKGRPTRSLYHFELLFELCRPEKENFRFYLAQDFYWFNPAKLPAPAEWVTIRRVRAKDAVDPIWWLSKSPFPKANNRRILTPYSKAMKKLLENGYNSGLRPSGHNISDTFQQDHGGAIPPNLLAVSNTESNNDYLRSCRAAKLPVHPARYPVELPDFFIRFLTDEDDWILDPFAGSNTTGQAAENNLCRWIAFEKEESYLQGSRFRFPELNADTKDQLIKSH